MALPILAAVLIAAFMAIDRATAVPWSGPAPGTPIIYKVVDAATASPVVGARVQIVDRGLVIDMPTSTPGHIRRFGGAFQGTGYRSLVRDTRRVEFGEMRLRVTAAGYEDYATDTSEAPLIARPTPDGKSVDYVIALRRIAE